MFVARLKRRQQLDEARERSRNLRAGLIAAEIRNTLRSKETDKVWTMLDYFPEPQEPQSEEQMLRMMEMWAEASKYLPQQEH